MNIRIFILDEIVDVAARLLILLGFLRHWQDILE